jgi:hypothetical protein
MNKAINKPLGSDNLRGVLQALDRQIALRGGGPIGLVVCGGSALAALGLTTRTTGDTDVLGQAVSEGGTVRIVRITAFPPWLDEAAGAVARDFALPKTWLNLGPASQLDCGLPEGLERRLQPVAYGPLLTAYYISRLDQIHFKLFAAVDRGPGDYHVSDLMALNPTPAEMLSAARWVSGQDASPEFGALLRDFLSQKSYQDVASKI